MGYYINLDEKLFWYIFLPFLFLCVYIYIYSQFVALITVLHKHNISLSQNVYVKSGEWSFCSIISQIFQKLGVPFFLSCLFMILICFVLLLLLLLVIFFSSFSFFTSGLEILTHTQPLLLSVINDILKKRKSLAVLIAPSG